MNRSAFTLVEMLVATMVFIIGFVGVYSLFIAGMNYRHEADRLTNTSLAATSLISTWRLEMQDQWYIVDDFVGDGNPTNGAESGADQLFYPYPDNPGIWFRVQKATDAAGQTGAGTEKSSTLRLEILLIDLGDNPDDELKLDDILVRHLVAPGVHDHFLDNTYPNTIEDSTQRSTYESLSSEDKAIYILVQRKVLARHEAIILRR